MNEQLQMARKYRKKAVLWIVVPYLVTIAILVIYAISSFVLTSINLATVAGAQEPLPTSQQVNAPAPTLFEDLDLGEGLGVPTDINYAQDIGLGVATPASKAGGALAALMGFLSLVSIILIPVGITMGVVNVSKAQKVKVDEYDDRSGKGPASEIPAEIKGWSWGAAGLNIIWGVYHSTWVTFVMLVPYLNLIFWIVLGIKGKEWAWRNMRWENVEDFKAVQKKWDIWGAIFFFLPIVLFILTILFFGAALV